MSTANIPTTSDVTSTLETGKETIDRLQNVATAYKEKEILEQTKTVISDTQNLLDSKNKGDRFQNFVRQLIKFFQDMSNNRELVREFTSASTKEGENLPNIGMEFVQNLRTVGLELLRSSDFRSLIGDIIDTLGQIFSSSLGKTESSNVSVESGSSDRNIFALETVNKSEINTSFKPGFSSSGIGAGAIPSHTVAAEVGVVPRYSFSNQKGEVDRKLDQLRSKLRGLLIRLSYNPNWRKAVGCFFQLMDTVQSELSEKEEVVERNVLGNKHLSNVFSEGRRIIEEFTGKEAMDKVEKDIKKFYSTVVNDREHRAFIGDWKLWFQDIMSNPERLETEDYQQRFDQLIERGYVLRDQIQPLLESLRALFDSAKYDKETVKLVQDTQDLADLVMSGLDDPRVRTHVRHILTNLLVDQFKALPLPPIHDVYEGTFGNYDYTIEGIVINTFDVLPDFMQIKLHTDVEFNLQKFQANKTVSYLKFNIEGMNAYFKDLHFAYKKIGSDSYDAGLLDVSIENANLNLEIYVNNPAYSDYNIFEIKSVDFNISKMNVHTHEAKWSTLYNMFSVFFTASIKKKISDRVEENIKVVIDNLNLKLNQLGGVLPQARLKDVVLGQFIPDYY